MKTIPLFATNNEVAHFESLLGQSKGSERALLLTRLAWHSRQRDCTRALALADEAEGMAELADLDEVVRKATAARLLLVRGEADVLFARLVDAQKKVTQAAEIFSSIGDVCGQGDAMWLQVSVFVDRGDGPGTDKSLAQAIALYVTAGETARELAAKARSCIYSAFQDPVRTREQLLALFPLDRHWDDTLAPIVFAAYANVCGLTDDPGGSIKHDLRGYQLALECGQIRQALVSVVNAIETFTMLGDLDAALEWSDPALTLARSTGWPSAVGLCQLQVGDVMRLLGRHDEARDLLMEAKSHLQVVEGSRNYEHVIRNLGQLSLDMGDFEAGWKWFGEFEQRVAAHKEADLLVSAWRGQACALMNLGREQEARDKAQAALDLARKQSNSESQIQVLSLLAQMHTRSATQASKPQAELESALQFLNEALDIASRIAGYPVSPDLLNQTAAAYASVGQFKAAYENSIAAIEARNLSRREEAQRRALAIEVRQEVERAKAETDRHREMAAALRETAATLETLGTIGREITASLDSKAVFDALHRHVNDLLDATVFAIYLIDEEHKFLVPAFAMEQGIKMPARPVALANPTSKSARSARRREEVIVNLDPDQANPNLIPGTLPTFSLLYFPLVVGERLLGVMSIQSPRLNAYGEREQSIFRALCAYGAIALDNAAAYSAAESAQLRADQALAELRSTQARLVEQNVQLERLAVTDQLTGLFNRLRLDHTLEEEHSRNMRYGTNFCILLLDIDLFKAVNDTFGHQTGDEVLVGIARTLQEGIREVDVAGRWGGEEFLIICRETVLEGALVLAEKLRLAVQAHVYDKVGKMSASFGVAMFRPGEVLTETIARADAALYRAKQAGRNRVENGEI